MELRIYYESIEQAVHYVKPIIEEYMSDRDESYELKLIELKGNYKYYGKNVAQIIFWKDPDILVTLVKESTEIPLLFVEFSTAVLTEDHELQRFDGITTAIDNDCIYAKISPLKESSKSHGGNIDFNHLKPYSQIKEEFDICPFYFEWPTDENNEMVKTHPDYLACPPELENFKKLLFEILEVLDNEDFMENWPDVLFEKLSEVKCFQEWFERLEECEIPNKETYERDSSRIYWKEENGEEHLVLKFNRFGHAMDPERGWLSYTYLIDENVGSKMTFEEENDAWYKSTPKEDKIRDYLMENGISDKHDLLYLAMLGSGLYKYEKFKEGVLEEHDDETEIDISDFLNEKYLELNKSLRTIIKFSNYFKIEDTSGNYIKLIWPDFREEGEEECFDDQPDVSILKERESISEDEVTYLSAYEVLKENGFELAAVSYPGAQGDKAILIEPGKGRKQKRKYVDIVSYITDEAINLQENKGKFSPSKVQGDIDEVNKYKTKSSYKEALETFKLRNDIPSPSNKITIGVGFWANQRFRIGNVMDLELKNLDYFIYIDHDLTEWEIWSNTEDNLFDKVQGELDLPKTYELVKTEKGNPKRLSDF